MTVSAPPDMRVVSDITQVLVGVMMDEMKVRGLTDDVWPTLSGVVLAFFEVHFMCLNKAQKAIFLDLINQRAEAVKDIVA